MPSIDIVVSANPIVISFVPVQPQTIEVKFGAVDSVNGATGAVLLNGGSATTPHTKVLLRQDTAANWTSANTVLSLGEEALETDTLKKKTGDGVTAWISLAYDSATRVVSITSSAAPAPNCDTTDEYEMTALAVNAVFGSPTGTPKDGQKILYRYKDNGTSRTIGLNSAFVDLTGSMPTSTTVSKVGMFGARWSSARSKWEIIATVTEP